MVVHSSAHYVFVVLFIIVCINMYIYVKTSTCNIASSTNTISGHKWLHDDWLCTLKIRMHIVRYAIMDVLKRFPGCGSLAGTRGTVNEIGRCRLERTQSCKRSVVVGCLPCGSPVAKYKHYHKLATHSKRWSATKTPNITLLHVNVNIAFPPCHGDLFKKNHI